MRRRRDGDNNIRKHTTLTRPLTSAPPDPNSFITVGSLAYAMRVAERPVCRTAAAVAEGWCASTHKDLDSALNSAWLVIITTLTVGCESGAARTRWRRCGLNASGALPRAP